MDIVKNLYKLFNEKGDEKYMIGEPITQIEHALQTYLAMKEYTSIPSLLIASALHDIGHFLLQEPLDPNLGRDDRHEYIGANYLRELGFPENVCRPIELHAKAKRYLLTTKPEYKNILTQASKKSAELQGGLMSERELNEFERDKYFQEALLLRKCDDCGKNTGARVENSLDDLFQELEPLILRIF